MSTLGAKVAVAQLELAPGALDANRERVLEAIRTAHGDGANLIVLPELASSGYRFTDWRQARAAAEPIPGPTTAGWQREASEGNCYIVGGICEVDGDALYDSAAVVGPDGVLGVYRKLHPWGEERLLYTAGNLGLPVFTLPFGRIGVLICYDLRFVEAARILALQGADLIAVPTAWAPGFDKRPPPDGVIGQVRAATVQANTSQTWIAAASRVGTDGPFTFQGSSVIVSPYGQMVYGPASMEEEVVHIEEIDLGEARRAKVRDELITPLADRRTDVYGELLGYDPAAYPAPGGFSGAGRSVEEGIKPAAGEPSPA